MFINISGFTAVILYKSPFKFLIPKDLRRNVFFNFNICYMYY